jgi:hypothetical protein
MFCGRRSHVKKNNKSLKKNVVNTKHEEKGRYYKNYMLLIVRSNDHLLKKEQNVHNIAKQKNTYLRNNKKVLKKVSEESFIEHENNEKIEC